MLKDYAPTALTTAVILLITFGKKKPDGRPDYRKDTLCLNDCYFNFSILQQFVNGFSNTF